MGTKTQNAADAQSAAFFAFSFGKEGIYYYLYILLNGRNKLVTIVPVKITKR